MNLNLNVAQHGWVIKKFFIVLSKTALHSIFLPFYLTLKQQWPDLHPVPEGFYKKRFVLKNCAKNSFEYILNYQEFRTHAEKDFLCFYKNYENQAFTFITAK